MDTTPTKEEREDHLKPKLENSIGVACEQEVPEQLRELARQLQAHLRHKQIYGK